MALTNTGKLLNNATLIPFLMTLGIDFTQDLIIVLAVSFMVAVVIASSTRLLVMNFQVRFTAAVGADISTQVYRKTLAQPYSFHLQHNSSDLTQILTWDTNLLVSQVLSPLIQLLNNLILVPALCITLVLIDPIVAILCALILGTFYVYTYKIRSKQLKQNSVFVSAAGQERIKLTQEAIGGIRDIILGHYHNYFVRQYSVSELRFRQANAKNTIIAVTPLYLVEGVTLLGIALLALFLARDGNFITVVPVLGSLGLGAKKLLPALQSTFNSFASIQGSRASLTRVMVALQRPESKIVSSSTAIDPLPLEQSIEIHHVWFGYDNDDRWVLQDLNLTIPSRSMVAFVGATGSGKSTTADLLLGLLQPQKGSIFVDGLPLEGEVVLKRWQKTIAHVPQAIFLSDGSIAENIAFGISPEDIDFERVRRAAKLAQIDNFIEDLPAQYQTYVGERGIRLSGGQRQRIGIARALYTEASVIIFDEATSALDNQTEKEVMDSINHLSSQFTIILIAHRLTTVQMCDYVFKLSHGQLIFSGSYKEFLE